MIRDNLIHHGTRGIRGQFLGPLFLRVLCMPWLISFDVGVLSSPQPTMAD